MIRRGFSGLLCSEGWKISGEAGTIAEAQDRLKPLITDSSISGIIILLDLSLNGEDGYTLIPWLSAQLAVSGCTLKDAACQVRVIIYSAFENVPRIQQAVNMGARGYVSKTAPESEVLAALNEVAAGRLYVDQKLLQKVLAADSMLELLTTRERTVLILVQDRLSNEEIASKMNLTTRTVENYLSRIYEKTGTTVRSELLGL